ncbi:MAG TPA: hypothetical protein VMA31_11485 [Bryobacteraceae bacterium]|nr:hypothetical protein [Bryobacteraceae bacterium]
MIRLLLFFLACPAGPADVPALAPLSPSAIEEANIRQLLNIHRVYVDRLTGGETAAQIREILMSTLQGSNLFILTENQERADTFLRGAAEDLIFTENHSTSDNVNVHGGVSGRNDSYEGGISHNATSTRDSRGWSMNAGGGEGESEHTTDRRHEAIAAVRLVNKDGDVIWATTQESLGAKFRGASADVAEKIAARLKEDFERAKRMRPRPLNP